MNIKGSLPLLILHILSHGPCHGYQINKQIRQASDEMLSFQEGTLYPTLHGLADSGVIEGYDDNSTGRRRRYYRLTDVGQSQLQSAREEWESFVKAVDTVLDTRFEC